MSDSFGNRWSPITGEWDILTVTYAPLPFACNANLVQEAEPAMSAFRAQRLRLECISNNGWITVILEKQRHGNGTVTIQLLANTGSAAMHIAIARPSFPINQAALQLYPFSPQARALCRPEEPQCRVLSPSGCAWTG